MLKKLSIMDNNDYSKILDEIIETELKENVDIIKSYLQYNGHLEYCKNISEDYYFNLVEWRGFYYKIEDVEIVKL